MKIYVMEGNILIKTEDFDDSYYYSTVLDLAPLVDTFEKHKLKEISDEHSKEKMFECDLSTYNEFKKRIWALEDKEMTMRTIISILGERSHGLREFVWHNQVGKTFWEILANANLAICRFLMNEELIEELIQKSIDEEKKHDESK
jgi:hypothetical protein